MARHPAPASKDVLFDLMVENVRDFAIVLLDTNGTVVGWNVGAERILGYTEREIVGESFVRFFTPEDIEARRPEHELATATETGRIDDENWMVRKDRTRFYASGVTTALRDGELRGFAKIFRDLTERKRLQDEVQRHAERLVEADRRKDEFLAMLAHELRNPLAPVIYALEVLGNRDADAELQERSRAMVERQVRHMARLIDDLLDVARITQGKVQLKKERVELAAVLRRAVETVRPLVESRRHELTMTVPAEQLWLDADPVRVEQIVGNLLQNAAKYTEPGGRIDLTASRRAACAVISVRDTGVGISADVLGKVFELFAQADRSLDRSQGGLGIGLTLVRTLVGMHGGSVDARSDGPGKGSEFVVELPLAEGEQEPLPASNVIRPRVPPRRVLIVDDNLDTAESLAMLLRLRGHEIATAHDGVTAVEEAQRFEPDVVLLDVGLPRMNGYDVMRRVRATPVGARAMLIAMTGYGQEIEACELGDGGFDVHLVKPAEPDHVLRLVATAPMRDP
jgi:PAS domain S-box-containing protein